MYLPTIKYTILNDMKEWNVLIFVAFYKWLVNGKKIVSEYN